MRVRSAMLFALALPAAGCVSTWNCKPDSRDFELDLDLSEADVAELLTTFGVADRTELDCESVCSVLEHEVSDWSGAISAETCELSLSTPTSEDPEEIVGTLSCAGTESEFYCEGRRPLGHVNQAACEGLAGYLAGAAHLEEASVLAFDELAEQLSAWGAPASLISRALLAAEQEREHAARIGGLAEAMGASLIPPAREAAPDDLFSAALHNAVEGCVGETWAALLAWRKAGHATTPELRSAYASLAADETGHAQLAWDLHAWMLSRLDPAQREAVIEAQRQALSRLPELARRQAIALPRELGLPTPDRAAEIAGRFAAGLLASVATA